MDLFTIIGACLRRWWVTVPVVALTAALAMNAYSAVAPVYGSSVSVVILPALPNPSSDGGEDARNPYASSGGPRFAAAVLSRNINGSEYRNRIGLPEGSTVTFESTVATQQPIMRIDATGPTPESVLEVLDAVAAEAEVVLGEFQAAAGAEPSTWYRTAPAVPASEIEDVTPSRFRTAGAVMAVGAALAAALATAVDALINRRRRDDDPEGAAEVPDPDDDAESETADDDVHPALAQPLPTQTDDDPWELIADLDPAPARTGQRRPPSLVRQVKRRPKPMQPTQQRPDAEPTLARKR